MDGIDYLNPSGICSSYERDEKIPIPKNAEEVNKLIEKETSCKEEV